MNLVKGTIELKNIKHPKIIFHVQSKDWYLLRLYHQDTLIYQYVGYKETLEVSLASQGYGMYEWTTGDITYSILEIRYLSLPELSYEVVEDEEIHRFADHYRLHERDVDIAETKYYKGDLHAHTILSDGSATPQELVEHAEQMGLDFFFITDHNFFHEYWPNTDVLVLPGVEYTGSQGHWNALNIKQPYDMYGETYDIETLEGTERLMKQMKADGALVSINHPFLTVWSWLYDDLDMDLVDTIEIWNDPGYFDNILATEEALKLWHASLLKGYRLTAVGGTDFHHFIDEKDNNRISALNDPTTHVYSEGLSKEKLLNHIKAGHIFVTRYIDVEQICVSINNKPVLFGEQYDSDNHCAVEFEIEGDTVLGKLHVFTKNEHIEHSIQDNKAAFEITLEDEDFIRFEIRNEKELLAFTNPIFHNEITKSHQTFGQLKGLMK